MHWGPSYKDRPSGAAWGRFGPRGRVGRSRAEQGRVGPSRAG